MKRSKLLTIPRAATRMLPAPTHLRRLFEVAVGAPGYSSRHTQESATTCPCDYQDIVFRRNIWMIGKLVVTLQPNIHANTYLSWQQ